MGAMSSGGHRGKNNDTPLLDQANTWTQVQIFEQGIQVLDSAVIGTNDGSAFYLGRANEAVRVNGELDVFSGLTQIRGNLYHSGSSLGFYGTAPIAKPTGVGTTAGAIHAALVSLGLIAA